MKGVTQIVDEIMLASATENLTQAENSVAPGQHAAGNQVGACISVHVCRLYRIVKADDYLQFFASDRSHMRGQDGSWHASPPLCPCIVARGKVFTLHKPRCCLFGCQLPTGPVKKFV